jgi:hypothetical protein
MELKYKATTLERHLKDLFGEETKLFSAAKSSQTDIPNIAVTTVAIQTTAKCSSRNELVSVLVCLRHVYSSNCSVVIGKDHRMQSLFYLGPLQTTACPSGLRLDALLQLFHFKPLEWQGHQLVDGAFKFNCPAACAYSEAQSIWPDKAL